MLLKKILASCFIISTIAIFLMSGCTDNITSTATPNNGDELMNNCRLIVKGKDITEGHYMQYNSPYFELPFIAILEALGARVEWRNQTTAFIFFNDKTYILNTEVCSFVADGDQRNIITTSPGGTRYYQVIGDEFILDGTTVRAAMYTLGEKMHIDYKNKIVEIG